MAKITTIVYDLAIGSFSAAIQPSDKPQDATKVSFHLTGDGTVDGTATIQLQESSVHGSGQEDIVGAVGTVNLNTSEFVGTFDIGGAFLNWEGVVGTATAGIVNIIVNYHN